MISSNSRQRDSPRGQLGPDAELLRLQGCAGRKFLAGQARRKAQDIFDGMERQVLGIANGSAVRFEGGTEVSYGVHQRCEALFHVPAQSIDKPLWLPAVAAGRLGPRGAGRSGRGGRGTVRARKSRISAAIS